MCDLCNNNSVRDWTHARSPGHLKKLKQKFKQLKKEEQSKVYPELLRT